jgi:hypothetical protein
MPPSIEKGLRSEGADASAFDIVPSVDDITMSDNPTKALPGQAPQQHQHRLPPDEGR